MLVSDILPFLIGAVAAMPSAGSANPINSLTKPSGPSGATIVHPGGIADLKHSPHNTLYGVYHSNETYTAPPSFAAQVASFDVELINKVGDGAKAYITGTDSSDRIVFVGPGGQLVYPSSGGSTADVPVQGNIAIPLAGKDQSVSVPISEVITSGRIWYAESDLFFFIHQDGGRDALVQPDFMNPQDKSAAVDWGFMEFTYTADGIVYTNLSFVDFAGMTASLELTTSDGGTQTSDGMSRNGVEGFLFATSPQHDWPKLVQARPSDQNSALRVISPNKYLSVDPQGGFFHTFWDQYVNDVWNHYSSNTLTIDTQSAAGKVACRVNGNVMSCDGSDRTYNRPSSGDIWGCNSGPFVAQNGGNDVHKRIVPRLCAAFFRNTLLIPGGDVQPGPAAKDYYQQWGDVPQRNYYGWIVKLSEHDGRGYAFSYDDVNPAGEEVSGSLSGPPSHIKLWVGGKYETAP